MKKLMILAACSMLAAVTQAAAVGWSMATGSNTYANNSYMFFVIGQNGATDIATITALLDDGKDVSSYAFGTGAANTAGTATVTAANSGKSLDAGTYTGFFVLFDSDSPTAGDKYVVVSGASTLTRTIAATTAQTSFASGNVASIVGNADNWKSYGSVPEPTSGLLMLLGVAGLALRRRRA